MVKTNGLTPEHAARIDAYHRQFVDRLKRYAARSIMNEPEASHHESAPTATWTVKTWSTTLDR